LYNNDLANKADKTELPSTIKAYPTPHSVASGVTNISIFEIAYGKVVELYLGFEITNSQSAGTTLFSLLNAVSLPDGNSYVRLISKTQYACKDSYFNARSGALIALETLPVDGYICSFIYLI
jgi:hypothetical protein